MKTILAPATLLTALAVCGSLCQASSLGSKVFNYEGLLPIKDDRAVELPEHNETIPLDQMSNSTDENAQAEAACWKLIHEQSVVAFEKQNKVLNELEEDLKSLTIDDKLKEFIGKTTKKMREDMQKAKLALEKDAADEFFDSLFDSSEDIIALAAILREPNLDDETFLAFVKAVSRLGRNNAELIQEFAEMCSFFQRNKIPRGFQQLKLIPKF